MSATKEFRRYYSPEVEKLVRQLKEAREEKTAAMQSFRGRVSLGLTLGGDAHVRAALRRL